MDFQKLNVGAIDARTAAALGGGVGAPRSTNSEALFWRRFKSPIFIKDHAPITSIHFVPSSSVAPNLPSASANGASAAQQESNPLLNPLLPQASSIAGTSSASAQSSQRYAVTSGTRVQMYSMRTDKVVKTVSRFRDVARSGNIRADGRLMVAGDDSGLVQVFDVNSRAILRTLKGHTL